MTKNYEILGQTGEMCYSQDFLLLWHFNGIYKQTARALDLSKADMEASCNGHLFLIWKDLFLHDTLKL